MRIYTKYGDHGNTQLRGGQQTRKNDVRISLCGDLDELNAVLGMVASHDLPSRISGQIALIQSDLFETGAVVAAFGADKKVSPSGPGDEPTDRLEREIDSMENELKPLQNFLLPGGATTAAVMHLARAVCRRAERTLTDLVGQPELESRVDASQIQKYLNRLSDWCFVAARYLNHQQGIDEPIWTARP